MTESAAAPAHGTKARRGRPPSTSLSQDIILDAAIAVIEREGPDALTLRRLGADLNANHTAVLRHFAGKDEILLGLAERLIEEALRDFTPSDHWRETMESMAHRVRAACLVHPGVALLVASRVSRRAAEFHGADVVIGALRQAGFDGRDAALYYRVLADMSLAAGAFEASFIALDSEARDGDRMAWRREYLAASPVAYPHLASVAQHLADVDEEDLFEATLGLTLDAVEARARKSRAAADE